MQEYQKSDFSLPQQGNELASQSDQVLSWKLGNSQLVNPFMNSTEELSTPLVESAGFSNQMTYPDNDSIPEEQNKDGSKEVVASRSEVYPVNDGVFDELLDDISFRNTNNEDTPYPVRGVSKYFSSD